MYGSFFRYIGSQTHFFKILKWHLASTNVAKNWALAAIHSCFLPKKNLNFLWSQKKQFWVNPSGINVTVLRVTQYIYMEDFNITQQFSWIFTFRLLITQNWEQPKIEIQVVVRCVFVLLSKTLNHLKIYRVVMDL